MAPKKSASTKPPEPAPGAPPPVKTWENCLTTVNFEEKSWTACVSMVVGGSLREEELLIALGLAVGQPLRKLFSVVTWDTTLSKIHEMGNPKNKKPKDVPMYYEVTEVAKGLLDGEQQIPCDLMAKLVKFQLLHIKTIDQGRRAAEQAAEDGAKGRALLAAAPKKKGVGKGSEDRVRKGLGSTSDAADMDRETKLRRRGEEQPMFIDDEPHDGPHHYFLLTGFHQAQLLLALDAVGVHVSNVIRLESKCTQRLSTNAEARRDSCMPEGSPHEPEGDFPRVNAGAKDLEKFWEALEDILDSGPPYSKLQDVARLCHTVPGVTLPLNLWDSEAMLVLGTRVFEGLAFLIYDCLELRRQHCHYQNRVLMLAVPSVLPKPPPTAPLRPVSSAASYHTPPPTTQPPKRKSNLDDPHNTLLGQEPTLTDDVDCRHYNKLLDQMPPEVCSVPLILHCMLEQVVLSAGQPPADMGGGTGPRMDGGLAGYMLHSALPLLRTPHERQRMIGALLTLVHNQQDRKKLQEKFSGEESFSVAENEQPLVFRHHNEIALRLRQISRCQSLDPLAVESSMMQLSPVWKLIHSAALQRNSDHRRMAQRQQLLRCCADEDVSYQEVERVFQHSVLESMQMTGLDQQGVLASVTEPLLLHSAATPPPPPPPFFIPWDHPLGYAKKQLHQQQRIRDRAFLTKGPQNSEVPLLELSDIQSRRLRSLSNWNYTEHHQAAVFPQVLHRAVESYHCVDTFRSSHDNTLYIICHNPMSPQRQCKKYWDMALHTDVGFRKYMEHVADAISDWTKNEGAKREAKREAELLMNLAQSESMDAFHSKIRKESPEPVIRIDSLKAKRLENHHEHHDRHEDDLHKKPPKPKDPVTKVKSDEKKPADKKEPVVEKKSSSSDVRSKADTTSSASMIPSDADTTISTPPPVEEKVEVHPAEYCDGFVGYILDGKLIQVSGCLQDLFPSDGGHITVENISFVKGSTLMKVCVKKDGHLFFTHINHVAVGPETHPHPPEDTHVTGTDHHKDVAKETHMTTDVPDPPKVVIQGSFSAVLDNGVHLSYSHYGPDGEYTVHPAVPETTPATPCPGSCTPNTPAKAPSPTSPPRHHHDSVSPARSPELKIPCELLPELPPPPLPSGLNLSVPNGLLLQLLTDGSSAEERNVLVRQSFPFSGDGVSGAQRDDALSREQSRVITSQGTVVRHMLDGATEVLFADGTVSFSPDSGPVWPLLEEKIPLPGPKKQKRTTAHKPSKSSKLEPELTPEWGRWVTTLPSGARISTLGSTHEQTPTAPVLTFHATDPITQAVLLTRQDRVVSLLDMDGRLIVEHADGTKITRLHQERAVACCSHTGVCASCPTECQEKMGVGETETLGHAPTGENGGTEGGTGKHGEAGAPAAAAAATGEWVVLVEREGCATVVAYPERRTVHVFLADRTVVTATCLGAYQVFPSSAGLLQIQEDGTCVYSGDPDADLCTEDGTPRIPRAGCYVMSHTDTVVCDVTDPDGNHFQVMQNGQISTVICSLLEEKGGEGARAEKLTRFHMRKGQHEPRMFMVHEDGSATELLSDQCVEEFLHQAYSDPTIALLKEPLPDCQEEFCITILKPSHRSVWSQWLLKKQNTDMAPPNLRNRSWHNFPLAESKTPGPLFGSDLGWGLTLRDKSPAQHQPFRSCPEALELRELRQHRPISNQLRDKLDTRLKKDMERLLRREHFSEQMKIKDPRTEDEKIHARDLLHLVQMEAPRQTLDNYTPAEIMALYGKLTNGSVPQPSDVPETAPGRPRDRQEKRKDSKWPKRIAQQREELCEERVCKEFLKNRVIVPYFVPENTLLHQTLLCHQGPDMSSLSMDLPPFPKTTVADAPQENSESPLGSTKSGQPDATWKPRKTKVDLPGSKYQHVDEPVRRRCLLAMSRGFQLIPPSVDFGTLREGSSYAVTVVMRNVGMDPCRFVVKQPPSSTGLRVVYNPCAVAAGLKAELKVELFAMAVVHNGGQEPKNCISENITITTEIDILYLPVTATILPEQLHDVWLKDPRNAHHRKWSKVRRPLPTPLANQGVGPPTEKLPPLLATAASIEVPGPRCSSLVNARQSS